MKYTISDLRMFSMFITFISLIFILSGIMFISFAIFGEGLLNLLGILPLVIGIGIPFVYLYLSDKYNLTEKAVDYKEYIEYRMKRFKSLYEIDEEEEILNS